MEENNLETNSNFKSRIRSFFDRLQAKLSSFAFAVNSRRKLIGGVLGTLVLTASLGTGLILVQYQKNLRTKAGGITLTLSSNNSSPSIGSTFVVAASIDTGGSNVSAADLKIKYDTTKLDALEIIPVGGFLPVVLKPGLADTATGMASIILGAPVDQTGAHPKSGTGLLAQITFKAKSEGSTAITLEPSSAVAAIGQTVNSVGTLTPVSVNVGASQPSPTATPTSTPTQTPAPTPPPTIKPTVAPTPTPCVGGRLKCITD